MLYLNCKVRLKEPGTSRVLQFAYLADYESESSLSKLTDTASITMPRKVMLKDTRQTDIAEIVKPGMEVEVYLGYNGIFHLDFKGYVVQRDTKIPFNMKCEDEMWKLKKGRLNKTFRKCKLKEIIDFVYSGKKEVLPMELSGYRIEDITPAQVLEDLKKIGIYSYFKNVKNASGVYEAILYVGFKYSFVTNKIGRYDFAKNIADNDLTYKRKDDVRIKVKAIGFTKANKQISVEFGDEDGELRTLPFVNVESESELKRLATEEIEKFKKDGYKGSFTGFGWPVMATGETAELNDDEYERGGRYLIDGVKVKFGTGGYRRMLEIGNKI